MSRSKWKVPLVLFTGEEIKYNTKIWKRNFQVLNQSIDKVLQVYDGQEFRKLKVVREKIGFKYGQFSFTRKHTKKITNLKNTLKKNAKK